GVSQVGIRFSDLQSVSERTAPGGKRITQTMNLVADFGCASLTTVARLGSSGRGFLPGCPRRLVWTRLPGFGPGDWGSNPHAGASLSLHLLLEIAGGPRSRVLGRRRSRRSSCSPSRPCTVR